MATDQDYMRQALRLARRALGQTSPNPMVGAVLVKAGRVIGRGWHRRAGGPHAEIEALRDAQGCGASARGATLYVTLEPCCTTGRTPPCTEAILAAGIRKVVVGAIDPNPLHRGKGLRVLERAGLAVLPGVLGDECERLNEAFNHWIVHRRPLVTVKAAMTLDGKIATASGESKWITSEPARRWGMKLRQSCDAILVGINTILEDDPSLTVRGLRGRKGAEGNGLCRIILDAHARTPVRSKVVSDPHAFLTTIVATRLAPKRRVAELSKHVRVLIAPVSGRQVGSKARQPARVDLSWVLEKLGAENVTSLLVEGGGEVNASFLLGGFSHRIAFFYAPRILGGRSARRAVAGDGATALGETIRLQRLSWRRLGPDWMLRAAVAV